MATIYFITDRKALLIKLAQIVDIAEGYDISVRRAGYVTVRHANTDTKPDGLQHAFVFDNTIWKHRAAILDELAKYGISKAVISAKVQAIRDGTKTSETVTFSSGTLAGVTLEWKEKSADWTPL